MAKKSLFEYGTQQDYTVGASNRPTDGSSVSRISDEVKFDGVNVVVDATILNCELGDMLIYDKQTLSRKLLKMATYNAATFDTNRYIKSNMFWHNSVRDTALFLYSGQTSARWAAQNEYKLSGFDLTQAGSFTFLSTGYQAAGSATTISWEANASLSDILAQFTTGNGGVIGNASYNTKAIEGSDIIFMVGGTGTNLITIGSKTGGASDVALTDYSFYCKIGDEVIATEEHRSFEGSTVTSLFGSYVSNVTFHYTSACYTNTNANRSWYTGVAFSIFKSYHAANGSTSFVSDITSNTSAPMKEATFLACKNSEVAAERECYERNNGSWDNYLHNMCANIEATKGTVNDNYANFGAQSKIRATIFYKNRNDEWIPCYPADYAASQMGVTVAGYTTGFEPGNLYMSDTFDFASYLTDEKRSVLNPYLTLVGGTTLGGSYLWTGSEYSGSRAWRFGAAYGMLDDFYKMDSRGVRASLALNLPLS